MYFRMMSFFYIHISQGNVATCSKRGGIFKHEFVANLLSSRLVKKIRKSDNSWWSYGQEWGVLFFLTHGIAIRGCLSLSVLFSNPDLSFLFSPLAHFIPPLPFLTFPVCLVLTPPFHLVFFSFFPLPTFHFILFISSRFPFPPHFRYCSGSTVHKSSSLLDC